MKRKSGATFNGVMSSIMLIAAAVIAVLCFVDFDVLRYGFKSAVDVYAEGYDYTEASKGTRVESDIYADEVFESLGYLEVTRTSRGSTTKTRTYYYVIMVYDDNGDGYFTTLSLSEAESKKFEKFVKECDASGDYSKTYKIQGVLKKKDSDVNKEFLDWIDDNEADIKNYFGVSNAEDVIAEYGIEYVDFDMVVPFYTIAGVCLLIIIICIVAIILHSKKMKKKQAMIQNQNMQTYERYDLNGQFGAQNNMNNQFGNQQSQDFNNNQNPYM